MHVTISKLIKKQGGKAMLFGWGRKQPSEPANIHPERKKTKIPLVKQSSAATPAETKPAPAQQQPIKPEAKPAPHIQKDGAEFAKLSKAEAEAGRKFEFEQLGIPYELVREAEKDKIVEGKKVKGISGITPQSIVREIEKFNNELTFLGFRFRIDYLECFNGEVMFTQYQDARNLLPAARRANLPDHKPMDFILLRRAEKVVREMRKIKENPAGGPELASFRAESIALYKRWLKESEQYVLRHDAERRLRRDKGLRRDQPLDEAEVQAMMKKIEAERLQLPSR